MDYQQNDEDEVEDLLRLLIRLKQDFPDCRGVAAGAIMSDYQRRRVVHVAERLNMTVLASLWHANQAKLVQSMLDCGMEIMLLKVASMGLNEKFVGKLLDTKMLNTFKELADKWGMNVAGEGGEYESLVLDCPLFKTRKLRIDKFDIILHSAQSKDAPVYYLKPLQISLVDKDNVSNLVDWISIITQTRLID